VCAALSVPSLHPSLWFAVATDGYTKEEKEWEKRGATEQEDEQSQEPNIKAFACLAVPAR